MVSFFGSAGSDHYASRPLPDHPQANRRQVRGAQVLLSPAKHVPASTVPSVPWYDGSIRLLQFRTVFAS